MAQRRRDEDEGKLWLPGMYKRVPAWRRKSCGRSRSWSLATTRKGARSWTSSSRNAAPRLSVSKWVLDASVVPAFINEEPGQEVFARHSIW